MKWYRNKEMLDETFEQNINYLQKTKSDKTKWLLIDYNNVIKDHLELLEENEKLKKIIKENFWVFNNDEVLFKFNENIPVMQQKIKEVLDK